MFGAIPWRAVRHRIATNRWGLPHRLFLMVRRGSTIKLMEKDTTMTTEQTVETDAVNSVASVEAELLVEEISIDGMCGVY